MSAWHCGTAGLGNSIGWRTAGRLSVNACETSCWYAVLSAVTAFCIMSMPVSGSVVLSSSQAVVTLSLAEPSQANASDLQRLLNRALEGDVPVTPAAYPF